MTNQQMIPQAPVSPDAVAAAEAVLRQAREEAAEAYRQKQQREKERLAAAKVKHAADRASYEARISDAVREADGEALAAALQECRTDGITVGGTPDVCVRFQLAALAGVGLTGVRNPSDVLPMTATRGGTRGAVAHPISATAEHLLASPTTDNAVLFIAVLTDYFAQVVKVRGNSVERRKEPGCCVTNLVEIGSWDNAWIERCAKAGVARYQGLSL